MGKECKHTSLKMVLQMADKHVRSCSSLVIRKMHVKTMMQYHHLSVRKAKIKKTMLGEGGRAGTRTAGENINSYNYSGK